MWSRRFLWVGLGSSLLVAALAVAGIWLVMRIALSVTMLDLASYAVCCAVGVVVYPLLWVLLVYARRSYSKATTYFLIGATYLISSAIVFGLFMLIGAQIEQEWVAAAALRGGSSVHHASVPSPQVLYGRLAIGGAILFLLPFAAIAGPLAFVHRRVLLTKPEFV